MSDLVWLSRVTLFGLVGTTALATLFFFISNRNTNFKPTQTRVLPIHQTNVLGLGTQIQLEKPPVQEVPVLPPLPQEEQLQSIPKHKNQSKSKVTKNFFDLKQSLITYAPLFATPVSLGMLAIGEAEGNYRLFFKNGNLYLEQTPSYFGHTDPGNLSWGEVVTNYGPCSDQGRSRGNIAQAEQFCLKRSLNRLPVHLIDLNAAGINPDLDLEALLNTADLYNQASPIHSRKFPKALVMARRGGKTGVEAIAWARTASFYLNSSQELDLAKGENQATGLLGICARNNLVITEWQCVYRDQLRRANAIAAVLEKVSRVVSR
ncbi:MAG: hypothetical protein AB4426_15450 [Xenococcaceae cyanobacterium]